jgi:hypothetical protein
MWSYLRLVVLVGLALGPAAGAGDETVYFLVAEVREPPLRNDCYVLPLDDPVDILDARHHLDGWPVIVWARVGSWDPNDGINLNRNYLEPNAPSWSWYVTELIGFVGAAPEICDGSPTGVEEDGEGGAGICFWAYGLVAELGTDLDSWCYVLEADCAADSKDLAIIGSHWLESGCEYPGWCGGADLNVSGGVDFIDFAILAEEWLLSNQGAAGHAVNRPPRWRIVNG